MSSREKDPQEYVYTLKNQLKYGDRQIIARVVNCSPELVKKVLSGERNHSKGKGRKIVEVAERVIKVRKVTEEVMHSKT